MKWKAIAWDQVLHGNAAADKIWMRSGLVRKDLLLRFASDLIPFSIVISGENVEELEQKNSINWWILKPPASSNAHQMAIVHTNDLKSHLKSQDRVILQQYLDQPALLSGCKFHLRVLVLAMGDLQVMVHHNIRVLRATRPFTMSTDDRLVHFTNRSVNIQAPEYDPEQQNQPLSALDGQISPHDVRKSIDAILSTLFQRLLRSKRYFFPLNNCFELFGADFMLDADGRVWLLEVNPDPSLSLYDTAQQTRLQSLETNLIFSHEKKQFQWKNERLEKEFSLIYAQ